MNHRTLVLALSLSIGVVSVDACRKKPEPEPAPVQASNTAADDAAARRRADSIRMGFSLPGASPH